MTKTPAPVWSLPLGARPRLAWAALWQQGVGTSHHLLEDHWTLHLVHYEADYTVGNHGTRLHPGHLVLVAPGVATSVRTMAAGNHAFAHFQLGTEARSLERATPFLLDVSGDLRRWESLFAEVIEASPVDPLRAEVLLWGLLQRLPSPQEAARTKDRPVKLRMALQQIEERLGQGITVRELVARVELSETHLARLFRKHLGTSVVGWIRKRRVEQAEYLLTHAPRTVSEIARAVGMHDLQYFNKEVRRAYGVSPRALRNRGRKG